MIGANKRETAASNTRGGHLKTVNEITRDGYKSLG